MGTQTAWDPVFSSMAGLNTVYRDLRVHTVLSLAERHDWCSSISLTTWYYTRSVGFLFMVRFPTHIDTADCFHSAIYLSNQVLQALTFTWHDDRTGNFDHHIFCSKDRHQRGYIPIFLTDSQEYLVWWVALHLPIVDLRCSATSSRIPGGHWSLCIPGHWSHFLCMCTYRGPHLGG